MNLRQIKLVLAVGGLFYAIFFGGFSLALGIVDKILKDQSPSLNISIYHFAVDGPVRYGYMDMAMRFCFVSVCLFFFILIIQLKKEILFEIAAQILVLVALYQIGVHILYSGPSYIPNITGNYDKSIIQILVALDLLFFGVVCILAILQAVKVWRAYKSLHSV